MGKKKKLQHFAENATFPHLFQLSYDELITGFHLKGKWRSMYFRNNHPVVVELGCGKGEYTVHLAARYPEKNFIGIDRKGARIWKGAKATFETNMPNVSFLRANIELIPQIFGEDEVDEIWITFPDPHPKPKSASRRLTSSSFIEKYRKILRRDGVIHLKTDHFSLFEFTRQEISKYNHTLLFSTDDLYNSGYMGDVMGIKTFYEEKFLASEGRICYLQFSLNPRSGKQNPDEPGFFEKVYQVARLIPYGKVTSYGAIAQYLGSKGSARMVGYAMNGSHASPYAVPAHRVVNRNGILTGKHHFGSPYIMAQLLKNEGIEVEDDKILRFREHFWDPSRELR
ncbi:MAG: tRNA (guanosine(46)-N7)-methyltransferase TrmB [Bacteroidales bacterium]